jgi:hypothetical protein
MIILNVGQGQHAGSRSISSDGLSRRRRAVTLAISISHVAIAILFVFDSLQQHRGVGGTEVAGATIPEQGRTRVATNAV